MRDITYPNFEDEIATNDFCPYVITGRGRASREESESYGDTIRDNK